MGRRHTRRAQPTALESRRFACPVSPPHPGSHAVDLHLPPQIDRFFPSRSRTIIRSEPFARPFIQRTHRLCPRPNDVLGTNRFAKFWPNLVTGCAVLFHNRDHEMRDASQGSSCSMNDDNDVFRREFRASLSMIADALDRLNALVGEKATSTEHELREQVAESEKLIDQSRMQARAAQNELNRLIEEQQLETSEKIADWKTHRQTSKLHARADRWERSAATAIEIAILAIDEAERAVLCALLTRKETISIQVQRR